MARTLPSHLALEEKRVPDTTYQLRLEFTGATEEDVRRALTELLTGAGESPVEPASLEVTEIPPLVLDPVTGTIVVALIGLGGVLLTQIVELVRHREEMDMRRRELEAQMASTRSPEDEARLVASYLIERIQATQGEYGISLSPHVELTILEGGERDA